MTDCLGWLLEEAARVRPTFSKRVQDAVSLFNRATSPADIGLDMPIDLWRQTAKGSNISVGDVVEVVERRLSKLTSRGRGTYAVVINARGTEYQLSVAGEHG